MSPAPEGWERLPSRHHTIRKLEILCSPDLPAGPKSAYYQHMF